MTKWASVAAWVCVGVVLVLGECPSPADISPCTCREETPGRTMECSDVTTSDELLNAFATNMPDPEFQYFQIVKLDGRCTLEKIPASVFGSSTFLYVWFGQTDIVSVDPDAFTGNEATMLELSIADANYLTAFPFHSVTNFLSLHKLEITHSLIDTLTHVGAAPNLTQVSVTNGQVSTVEAGAVSDLPRLARLDLHGNPLTALTPDSLAASTSEPWVVYLDGCAISDISPDAFSGSLPAGVFLNGNQMTAISEATFRPLLEHLQATDAAGGLTHYVDFTNNPLVCDCGVQWIAQDPSLLPYLRNAVCTNGEVAGVNVGDLPGDFFVSC